ncbi:MAG: hypothetical protein N4A32_03930 [Marinifilaceae bacterium]|jgi:uncharacterized membrane protein YbhN (UPF0104 family)|nr:hypothetical protein [Marinifilaceae bacterium]
MKKNKPRHIILFIILLSIVSFLIEIFYEYINCSLSDAKQSIDYTNLDWIGAPIGVSIFYIFLYTKRKVFNKS